MSADPAIRRLGGAPDALAEDELLALYAPPEDRAWLRVNFIASVDGASSVEGRSGGLHVPADTVVFDLLRRMCDVVIVASGTVKAEGYGPMVVDDASAAWRVAHGYAAQPVFAIVTGSLSFEPADRIFAEAPVRPVLLTTSGAPAERRTALAPVADVLEVGGTAVDPTRLVAALAGRGLRRMHCEGGPSLLGGLVASDVVDELCLTISPLLASGDAARIAHGAASDARRMSLAHALESDDALLLRYLRDRAPSRVSGTAG